MTANSKAKLKTLYVMQMLQEETDSEHGLTMSQIISRLEGLGISAERKGIYRDIELLREFGMDIKTYQRNPLEYALDRRDFDLSELMLIVDAVQSSKLLTQKQAGILVGNIKSLASIPQQEQLDRTVHVAGRINAESEGVFQAIGEIHRALRERKQIRFRYLHYGVDGKRHDSGKHEPHRATPISVAYDNGFYYLTTWDEDRREIRERRVDRMECIEVVDEPATSNEETQSYSFDEQSAYEYFGRFDGPEKMVTLAVKGESVEIIRDRFGGHAQISRAGDDARAVVNVRISPQFFGWVAGLNGAVTIAGPQSVLEEYRDYLRKLLSESLEG